MKNPITDMQDLINLSINWTGESEELDCDITLREENHTFKAHTVSVCNRDLLFYTDKGYFNYVVDSYGDNHIIELFDFEID